MYAIIQNNYKINKEQLIRFDKYLTNKVYYRNVNGINMKYYNYICLTLYFKKKKSCYFFI